MTSPFASLTVLPISRLISSAKSSARSVISSNARRRISPRSRGAVVPHSCWTSAAASSASTASLTSPSATSAMTEPSAGSRTEKVAPLLASRQEPPMKSRRCSGMRSSRPDMQESLSLTATSAKHPPVIRGTGNLLQRTPEGPQGPSSRDRRAPHRPHAVGGSPISGRSPLGIVRDERLWTRSRRQFRHGLSQGPLRTRDKRSCLGPRTLIERCSPWPTREAHVDQPDRIWGRAALTGSATWSSSGQEAPARPPWWRRCSPLRGPSPGPGPSATAPPSATSTRPRASTAAPSPSPSRRSCTARPRSTSSTPRGTPTSWATSARAYGPPTARCS